MRIAIIGTGGIGAYYASALIEDGQDVHLVGTPRHVEAIASRGLRITTDEGDRVVHPASVTTDPDTIGVVDIVIVAVKLYQLDGATAEIASLMGPNTLVITLQNGVSAPDRLAARVGADHVVPGLAVIVAFVEGPGHVRQIGSPPGVTVGARSRGAAETEMTPATGIDPRIAELVAAFVRGGVVARASAEIDHDLWKKFALITTFGGVDVLAHATIGEVRSSAPTRVLQRQSLGEVQTLARARGIMLSNADLNGILAQLDSLAPDATTSMQRDLEAGHPSELEDLNGAVVRLAAESGLDVPFHSIATAVMRLHAERGHV